MATTQIIEEHTATEVPTQHVVTKTTNVVPDVVSTEPPQKVYKTKKQIFRIYQVIWYLLGILEVLLVFRFFLKLIGANSFSGFTLFIYGVSAPFAVPFLGVIPPTVTGSSVMEWSTLLAMVVYGVVAWGIIELFQIVKPVDQVEVENSVDAP